MKEIINKIEEVYDWKPEGEHSHHEGFKISTNKQDIYITVSGGQCCCEDAGYLSSNDNLEEFIGAELLDIKQVDEALNAKEVPKDSYASSEYFWDGGGIIFINLETSKGTAQFAVYNRHNGYYGHSVSVKSNQLSIEDFL